MPISTTRPEYDLHVGDWRKVRDCVAGEAKLRQDITTYLPVPPGLNISTEVLETGKRISNTRYHFYASFAEFPEIVSPTLNGILGLVHEKKPEIELPKDMEYLLDSVTPDGETLLDFWERCTQELLMTGRFVTLGEIVGDKVYLCEYPTESLINWRMRARSLGGGPEHVVLHEVKMSPKEDDIYTLEEVNYYRELLLVNDTYYVRLSRQKPDGELEVIPLGDDVEQPGDGTIMPDGTIAPTLFGKTMSLVPITVVNTLTMGFDYGPIPLLPMTRRALSIFRKSADYNRSLYIKGDPQCVIYGIDSDDIPTDIGGGSIWAFENPDAKAHYLDIDGQGIPLMRQSIADEFDRFADEVGMLLEGSATGYESGEALRRRQSMRQVTIKSVIINAAEGMQESLRVLGRMMGKSEDEVKKIVFKPNLDFTEPLLTGQELMNYVNAKKLGAPMSAKTLHELMRRRMVTDLSWEEEEKLLDKEKPRGEDATPNEPTQEGDQG